MKVFLVSICNDDERESLGIADSVAGVERIARRHWNEFRADIGDDAPGDSTFPGYVQVPNVAGSSRLELPDVADDSASWFVVEELEFDSNGGAPETDESSETDEYRGTGPDRYPTPEGAL